MIDRKDLEIFKGFVRADRQEQAAKEAPGDGFLRAGRYFLGTPYEAKTLDASGPEGLIINLRSFDCFTLVENCCALTLMRHAGKDGFVGYAAILQSLRYRNGVIAGYPSRLHYFSDWLQNSEGGGLIREVTRSLGGRSSQKVLNFMTTHSELYPPLRDLAVCRQMIAIEERLSDTPRHLLPKGEIGRWEGGIEDGDILAITAGQEGLDVCHVGISVRLDGQLHLLHASQQAGQVVISPETLVDYLHQSPHRTGVMVARLALPYGNH
ncbi:MAG: N-acetylmuramoyl-L-alanine amidase-like domain-containing protein [Syntrophales bacterium]